MTLTRTGKLKRNDPWWSRASFLRFFSGKILKSPASGWCLNEEWVMQLGIVSLGILRGPWKLPSKAFLKSLYGTDSVKRNTSIYHVIICNIYIYIVGLSNQLTEDLLVMARCGYQLVMGLFGAQLRALSAGGQWSTRVGKRRLAMGQGYQKLRQALGVHEQKRVPCWQWLDDDDDDDDNPWSLWMDCKLIELVALFFLVLCAAVFAQD